MARTLGSKNKFPAHEKIMDELMKYKFNWISEFVGVFRDTETNSGLRVDMLKDLAQYLFPKRKPEDSVGDSSESPLVGITVTNEQLADLVRIARGDK